MSMTVDEVRTRSFLDSPTSGTRVTRLPTTSDTSVKPGTENQSPVSGLVSNSHQDSNLTYKPVLPNKTSTRFPVPFITKSYILLTMTGPFHSK